MQVTLLAGRSSHRLHRLRSAQRSADTRQGAVALPAKIHLLRPQDLGGIVERERDLGGASSRRCDLPLRPR
eukprot:s3859_g2.t1